MSNGEGRVWNTLLAAVWWFRPQNHRVDGFTSLSLKTRGGGSEEERTARGGIEEFTLRRRYLMKGAVAVR
jgi:hypothetical protein